MEKHIHNLLGSITGIAASAIVPSFDVFTSIFIGISVGTGTWMMTKGISFLIERLRCK